MEVDSKNFFKELALSWALKDLNRWSFENGHLGQGVPGSKGMLKGGNMSKRYRGHFEEASTGQS